MTYSIVKVGQLADYLNAVEAEIVERLGSEPTDRVGEVLPRIAHAANRLREVDGTWSDQGLRDVIEAIAAEFEAVLNNPEYQNAMTYREISLDEDKAPIAKDTPMTNMGSRGLGGALQAFPELAQKVFE